MKKFIPDCYWPGVDNGLYVSHEAICVLNPYEKPVTIKMTLYFEDREKVGGFIFDVDAERTMHIRMDKIKNADGFTVPRDTPYAALLECDDEISVQYTRVDTTQAELTISSTIV